MSSELLQKRQLNVSMTDKEKNVDKKINILIIRCTENHVIIYFFR